MKHFLFLFIISLAFSNVNAQVVEQGGLFSARIPAKLPGLGTDTIYPPTSGDSCNTALTYYTFNGQIISGAAQVGQGQSIQQVGQMLNIGGDSLEISSILALIVHKSAGNQQGNFRVSLYDTSDLAVPFATSQPLLFDQITDSSDVSLVNRFPFNPSIKTDRPFWAVLEVINGTDSLFLASTNDDCGEERAIFKTNSGWYYYADEFELGPNDPLDIALGLWAVVDQAVSSPEYHNDQLVEVYPNPANDKLYFKAQKSNVAEIPLRIYHLGRELVLQTQLIKADGKLSLDISHLPPGVYQYWLGSEESVSGSFIKLQ